MLFELVVVVSVVSLILIWVSDGFKGALHELELKIGKVVFFDRLNKEKYLEEVGYNVMNDPW